MKPFLTKEQGEFLIKILMQEPEGIDPFHRVIKRSIYQVIKKAIDKYTIKEFPELHMLPEHMDDKEEIRIYETDCANTRSECIVVYSYEEYTHMNKSQFKQFAEGVAEIAKWIEENE